MGVHKLYTMRDIQTLSHALIRAPECIRPRGGCKLKVRTVSVLGYWVIGSRERNCYVSQADGNTDRDTERTSLHLTSLLRGDAGGDLLSVETFTVSYKTS